MKYLDRLNDSRETSGYFNRYVTIQPISDNLYATITVHNCS